MFILKMSCLLNLKFQEHILRDRDRVVSNTWYNEEKKRWEMDLLAVPFAVTNKLVEHARIRHDWAVMYLAIKGDDKEYYVDIKVGILFAILLAVYAMFSF